MTTPRLDHSFFTNDETGSLADRFTHVLKDTQFFDVIVGYFRTSGFRRMRKALSKVEKMRLLVGLSIDHETWRWFVEARQGSLHEGDVKQIFSHTLQQEFEQARSSTEDSKELEGLESAAHTFINMIRDGRLEIKAHPSKNLHAKVYIMRFREDDRDTGRLITGSSNFSYSGLVGQREFNVELKQSQDVAFAQEQFEKLWAEAVDLSETYVETVTKKTWLNKKIRPYEIYLKFLYEFFYDELDAEEIEDFDIPDGFLELAYQKQAVQSATRILEKYNGVFLADVVGLGKTFIAALILQSKPGRKLILCPPPLVENWKEALQDFGVGRSTVVSIGKLDQIGTEGKDYDYIIVDEAHRFRNDTTQGYGHLVRLCRNKKVILVSATPLNNHLTDILNLLKLFQPAHQSTIPGVPHLEAFFQERHRELQALERQNSSQEEQRRREIYDEVRDRVLRHIMVRRTRSEIQRIYEADLKEQGLSFPDVAPPNRMVYTFDEDTEQLFSDTLQMLRQIQYVRYRPLLFLKVPPPGLSQGQVNIGGFMKTLALKRLESSFYAFKQTVARFCTSYRNFIDMFDRGAVYVGDDLNLAALLETDTEEELDALLQNTNARKYKNDEFKDEFRDLLAQELATFESLHTRWSNHQPDPKLSHFIEELQDSDSLKNKKLLIFTEAKDTALYLYEALEREFGNRVMAFSSSSGRYEHTEKSSAAARLLIRQHFDPQLPDELKLPASTPPIELLITTDVLAEGMNLHCAGNILNYDLPWNPTRVLQRIGRINRVGSGHETIFVHNYFPSEQSRADLSLEDRIISRLQGFHDTLGEDAKYLSEDEEISAHQLFGRRLFDALNNPESLEEREDAVTELDYIKELRDIRDDQSALFAKIAKLPKQARCARTGGQETLLSFFRQGLLKRLITVSPEDAQPQELPFLEAAALMKCEPDAERLPLPDDFYQLLNKNESFFVQEQQHIQSSMQVKHTGHSQELLKILRFPTFSVAMHSPDGEALKMLRNMIEAGTLPKSQQKDLVALFKKHGPEPSHFLRYIEEQDLASLVINEQSETMTLLEAAQQQPPETILSLWLAK